jgi:hypothetical protein
MRSYFFLLVYLLSRSPLPFEWTYPFFAAATLSALGALGGVAINHQPFPKSF